RSVLSLEGSKWWRNASRDRLQPRTGDVDRSSGETQPEERATEPRGPPRITFIVERREHEQIILDGPRTSERSSDLVHRQPREETSQESQSVAAVGEGASGHGVVPIQKILPELGRRSILA